MAVLLEENTVPSGQSPLRSHQSQIPFCTSHTQILPPPQVSRCTLTSMEYSPTHPHLLMTTHKPTTTEVNNVSYLIMCVHSSISIHRWVWIQYHMEVGWCVSGAQESCLSHNSTSVVVGYYMSLSSSPTSILQPTGV